MRCTKAMALAAMLVPAAARADDLQVTTEEFAAWPTAIAALQANRESEGSTLHVIVRDGGSARLPCGGYSLGFDSVSHDAFVTGACDPATGATEVRLTRRAALFDHSDAVPRPLAAGISATQVRTSSSSGGAASEGGSEVSCTVAVHPYVDDLEHGGRVFLSPGRYILRPLVAGVTASAQADGWLLRGGAQIGLTIEYDVLDTQRHEVVVYDRATLTCGTERLGAVSIPGVTVVAPGMSAGRLSMAGVVPEVLTTPTRPSFTWMFQWGFGGIGIANIDSMRLYGDANGPRQGSSLYGLGTQLGGTVGLGDFGLSFDVNWVYASIETGWYYSGTAWEFNARGTLGPSLRFGQVLLYAGPTAFASYLGATDTYGRTYNTGLTVTVAATAGIRYRFEDWNPDRRRFGVIDLFLEGVVPITGSEGFVVAGMGFGRGY